MTAVTGNVWRCVDHGEVAEAIPLGGRWYCPMGDCVHAVTQVRGAVRDLGTTSAEDWNRGKRRRRASTPPSRGASLSGLDTARNELIDAAVARDGEHALEVARRLVDELLPVALAHASGEAARRVRARVAELIAAAGARRGRATLRTLARLVDEDLPALAHSMGRRS